MNREEYLDYCRKLPGAGVDQPFLKNGAKADYSTCIARHLDNGKWFAAVMGRDGKIFVNLKGDPEESDFLRSAYKGIRPGYHMNKWHWNSVYLESDVPQELIRQLTEDSFHRTESKRRAVRPEGKKKGNGR